MSYPDGHWLKLSLRKFTQARRGGFCGNVPLRHPKHFKADHKLAYRSRAQQRGVIVGVEMPLRVRLPVRWLLVETHGVREGDIEEMVVPGGEPLHDVGQIISLFVR